MQQFITKYQTITFVFVVHVIAILYCWQYFTREGAAVCFVSYLLRGLGVTVGFHRYFTHTGFKTYRPIRWMLALLGNLAVQGHNAQWVDHHRVHHRHSDKAGDPHSPVHNRTGTWDRLQGFWHAHVGWLTQFKTPLVTRHARSIEQEPMIWFLQKTYLLWHIALCFGLLYLGQWYGGHYYAVSFLIWGYFVSTVILSNATFAVNSVCHISGYTGDGDSRDNSKNNWIVGILSFGEGFHHNHHVKESRIRHGLKWWEFDISYWTIKSMEKLGLAWDLKE